MHHSPFWRHASVAIVFCLLALSSPAADKPSALPAHVNQLIDVLFKAPEMELGSLSPDGLYFAFTREINEQKVLVTYNFKTREFHSITGRTFAYEDVVLLSWGGPNQLLFEMAEKSQYYRGLWSASADLSARHLIDPGDKRPYFLSAALPQNPDFALLWGYSRFHRSYGPLYALDKKTNYLRLYEDNPGNVIDWTLDAAGTPRLATVQESGSRVSFLFRPSAKGAWQPIKMPEGTNPLVFDPSGQNILISHPNNEGRETVQNFNLQTRELEGAEISDPVYDVIPDLLRDPHTDVPFGLRFWNEKRRYQWLDPHYQQIHAVLSQAFPGREILPYGRLFDDELLFAVISDVKPFALFRYDPVKREAHKLIDSHPAVSALEWAPMQPVMFKARDGYDLHGYLTLPLKRTAGQHVPLIALSHGGPFTRDNWGFEPEVQFFAALGYAVLQVDYRGSSGYGKKHRLKTILDVNDLSVDDVVDGIRWAIGENYADPRKIVAYGGSYGGYISLAIATRYPDLPAAVIGFAGVYDWEEQMIDDRDEMEVFMDWRADYYVPFKESAGRYRTTSPSRFADKVRCPVLLLHGDIDARVDMHQSRTMAKALRAAGKQVEVVKNVSGIHGLPREGQRRAYYSALAAFLLKNVPPDAP